MRRSDALLLLDKDRFCVCYLTLPPGAPAAAAPKEPLEAASSAAAVPPPATALDLFVPSVGFLPAAEDEGAPMDGSPPDGGALDDATGGVLSIQ